MHYNSEKIQSDAVKCHCCALSWCFSELILCTAVTGGWVGVEQQLDMTVQRGSSVSTSSVHATPGVSASRHWGFSWPPRHCLGKREQEQSTVYSSLVRVCTALLSLSCAGSCGWYIPDNELGAAMGGLFFPLFFLNTKSQIDQLPVLIKFYFHGWGWSTLLFHPVNVQRSCGMGVASIIQGNKCLFSTK